MELGTTKSELVRSILVIRMMICSGPSARMGQKLQLQNSTMSCLLSSDPIIQMNGMSWGTDDKLRVRRHLEATGQENRDYSLGIRHANHVAPSIRKI
jgi:hypothetical protein